MTKDDTKGIIYYVGESVILIIKDDIVRSPKSGK